MKKNKGAPFPIFSFLTLKKRVKEIYVPIPSKNALYRAIGCRNHFQNIPGSVPAKNAPSSAAAVKMKREGMT